MQQLLAPTDGAHAPGSPGDTALRHDLTELAGLDYLSSPSSVILEAQQLAAAACGADATWFLVNGCSAGIHAAVLAALRPGQALLLARNCHLSVFAACVLADCVPVWLQPEQDVRHGVAHCVQPQELRAGFEAARQRGLHVGAALVVSPTYFGVVAHVRELADICHAEGVPLLVDEAHGGHLSFMQQDMPAATAGAAAGAGTAAPPAAAAAATVPAAAAGAHAGSEPPAPAPGAAAAAVGGGGAGPVAGSGPTTQLPAPLPAQQAAHQAGPPVSAAGPLPPAALAEGADVVMHSSHKVLTAMTQAAMLHLKGGRVDPNRISRALQVLQTSSPSYILLASLDAARRHATRPGAWALPLAAAAAARAGLQRLPGLALLQAGSCGSQASAAGFDPLRVVLNVGGCGWRGFDAATWLEREHGIVPELASTQLVVFVFGPGSTMADAARLVEACGQLPLQLQQQPDGPAGPLAAAPAQHPAVLQEALERPPAVLTPRQAFGAATEAVPLRAAVGRVSAELLCPYPPGVPVVFPGEELSSAAVALLQHTLACGGVVTGGHDSQLTHVLVVV